jgi:hypothetical protein
MLYKFINENQIKPYKGGFVVLDNKIYTNPKEETLAKAGYKELAGVEKPEYDEQMQYLKTTYKDGDIITPVYEVLEYEEIGEELQ